MTALVKGLALGVTPDEPETELYDHGDQVVVGTRAGDINAIVIHHEPPWIEITAEHATVGWTVHERQVSPR